jgi:hypothetical protein
MSETIVHTGPAPAELVRCIIRVADPLGTAAIRPVFVNGVPTRIAYNTPIDVPAEVYEALANSDLKIERLPDGEDSPPAQAVEDEAGAGGPGGASGAGEPAPDEPDASLEGFDANEVIVGTIAEVEQRLAALTPAQLGAVKAAERARDKPRKGIIELIDKAAAPAPAATKE